MDQNTVQRETIGMQKMAKRTECLLFWSDQASSKPESESETESLSR